MSTTSSPDQVTTPFESGRTWDAENREASLPGCELLLATPTGNTSPLYLMTEPFESGTPRLMRHLANLERSTELMLYWLFLSLLIGTTWSLDLLRRASRRGNLSHMFSTPRPLMNQFN